VSTLYAESSAVLRWLLGTEDGGRVRDALAGARDVISSALTAAEVARTLRRLAAERVIDLAQHDAAWARFTGASAHWYVYAVSDAVLDRACQPFPREPVRTLDAVHLATAVLIARDMTPPTILTVDHRVRDNAAALGLAVAPAE
jgi:predicted nucleic acid-binding protein